MAKEEIKETLEEEKPDVKAEEPKNDPIAIAGTTITKGQLAAYKEQYQKVFMTDYMGKRYVWRRMTDDDYEKIMVDTNEITDEDKLINTRFLRFVKTCTLYPATEELEQDLADEMVLNRLVRTILFRSGMIPPHTEEL